MLRKLTNILLIAVLALLAFNPNGAYATYAPHTSNQYFDSGLNSWVSRACDDGVVHFEVYLATEINQGGYNLLICQKEPDLSVYSVGNTTLNWGNKTSSLSIAYKDDPSICVEFYDLKNYQGEQYNFAGNSNGNRIDDLSRVAFGNKISSLQKIYTSNCQLD